MVTKSKRIAFCTHASDDYFFSVGGAKLVKTFKYFHSDTPFFVFGTNEINALNKKYHNRLSWLCLMPFIVKEMFNMGYETVVRIDADSIITGPILDIVLESTADVMTVRNNNDKGLASKDGNPAVVFNGCAPDDYKNAGFVGINSQEFNNEWLKRSLNARPGAYTHGEQDILNEILQEKKFTEECLDRRETSRHMGISCLDGKETYWDSLKNLYVYHDEHIFSLAYKGKDLLVIHQAGGHKKDKMNFDELFSPGVAETLRSLTQGPVSYERPEEIV